MDSRPKGLAFFRPLITLLVIPTPREVGTPLSHHDNQSEIFASKCLCYLLMSPCHKTGYYTDVRNNPQYKDIVTLAEKYAITLNRRGLGARLFAPEVKIESRTFSEDGSKISKTVFEYRRIFWTEPWSITG